MTAYKNVRRTGFALVSTLLLLAIVGLVLSQVASISLHKSMDLLQQAQETRELWALASVERTVFPISKELVGASGGQTSSVERGFYATSLDLGNVEIVMLVADESAKLDLNSAATFGNARELKNLARQLAADQDLIFSIRSGDANDFNGSLESYESWDQIVEMAGNVRTPPERLIPATRSLSLWGGRVNVKTAPDPVLAAIGKLASGSILASRLIDARRESQTGSVSDMLESLALPEEQIAALEQYLDDRSSAQSIWMSVRDTRTGQMNYQLRIRQNPVPGIYRFTGFSW